MEEAIRDEGGVTQPATQNNDDEDEDEVRVEPGQKGLAPNETCPLSGRAVRLSHDCVLVIGVHAVLYGASCAFRQQWLFN